MILIIDNYDSFVYNLARYVSELDHEHKIARNDKITLADIELLKPSHIILSPGPRSPNEAGICCALIRHFGDKTPILGICLGHQAIGQAYGGTVTKAKQPMHGQSSLITHDQQNVFANLPNPLTVGRYHSLIVEAASLPDCLQITAYSANNEIMALQHKINPVVGLQFHPESILTTHGHQLLQNFLA